jgi:hypothetical protein
LPNDNKNGPPSGGAWPDPRLRALQVDELYRYAPAAAGFSYFVALLTLGVLIETGDMARGVVWFLWATAVTVFRFLTVVLYRRREPSSDPITWGKLVIAANLLAGIQWAVLGTLLFAGPVYRELYIVIVITCTIGGSLVAYAPLRWAHEALSLTAGIPLATNLMLTQDGQHAFVGITAFFFCFAIVYYSRKHSRHIEEAFQLQIERDELLAVTAVLNEKLASENRELAHRVAVRGVSVENAARSRIATSPSSRTRRCRTWNATAPASSSRATRPPSASSASGASRSPGVRSTGCWRRPMRVPPSRAPPTR